MEGLGPMLFEVVDVEGVSQYLESLFWRVGQDYVDIWIYSWLRAAELSYDFSLKFSRDFW